jgi:nitrite reductase/ring-hydroxylating ferredoxin subunit
MPGQWIVVAREDELQPDQMKLLRVNSERLVLARTNEGYAVFEDRCSHRGGSLAGGVLICGTVQCPWHGSQFDVRSGEVKAGPAKAAIRTRPLDISNGEVRLQI